MSTTTDTTTPAKKEPKKKGPIRFEAIIPVLVISILTFLYFSWYFDHHLKKIFEYVGTQANGAEVNVGNVETSFISGKFTLSGLQVTDPEKPSHNTLEVGSFNFKFLWDALLRMKFVVEDASILDIQLMKPRKSPGYVLPPKPASPSKMESLQQEVIAQVKNKYGMNVLGDVVKLIEGGGDYEKLIQDIRGQLKSEARAKAMVEEVNVRKEFWDGEVKRLGDTSKLKEIEKQVATVRGEKNFLQQAAGVKKLTDLLEDVRKQAKEIEKSSKLLQTEVKAVADYPKELQKLVNEDINSLKDRFKIPKIDFKDMAMHLFAGDLAEYIAKARKYQALAKEYIPEKKEKEEVIPPKRDEGRTYQFPVTTGYPLFWLKKAAISSKGTAESYSGDVKGELTNVTTSPKMINDPLKLDLNGNFPASKIMGVRALFTVDHRREVGKQTALIQVNQFSVPQKMFSESGDLKFGFLNALGSSTIKASLEGEKIDMSWTSALTKPQFLVETKSKLVKEILSNVVNTIPVINIDGRAGGTFKNLDLAISSNLGDELGKGFTREIGLKVAEAQNKLNTLVEEKINAPKKQLEGLVSGQGKNLSSLSDVQGLYKQNEDKIKSEIDKLKSGGGSGGLKEQGKKLFKGIKF